MAKKKNSIEKNTRKAIEAVSEMIKIRGGKVKWKKKLKKKEIRLAQVSCFHWHIRNGKANPTLVQDEDRPGYWTCRICHRSFPISPLTPTDENPDPYADATDKMLELVNQIAFWSVRFGGDGDDSKMFMSLKKDLERFKKVSRAIVKRARKRDEFERQQNKEGSGPFNAWATFNYRPKG